VWKGTSNYIKGKEECLNSRLAENDKELQTLYATTSNLVEQLGFLQNENTGFTVIFLGLHNEVNGADNRADIGRI